MNPFVFDIWLHVGREGRCFSYQDGNNLHIELGDVVTVRLKGRLMQGLVVKKRKINSKENLNNISFNDVVSLVQKAAIKKEWREWLGEMARELFVSDFQMLKAALPPGWLGRSKLSKRSKKLWWVKLSSKSFEGDISTRQIELKEHLLLNGGGKWQKDLEGEGFSSVLIKNFILTGCGEREKRLFLNDSSDNKQSNDQRILKIEDSQPLTLEQKLAKEKYKSLQNGSTLLLWGITGSGKTEVYLQIAALELSASRHCLILTPEIGLVPQLVDRFRKRFGENVFEYHSNCSPQERIDTWKKSLETRTPSIFIGTRSAIFLPLSNLGLIVLDEEHDSSYKQESPMPCYHARDLAIDRAKKIGAKVILGTATPSLSIWRDIEPKGNIIVARLTRRILNRKLPMVNVVDMREELAIGNRSLISRYLKKQLLNLKNNGNQAIILVPRRGYSSFLSCRSCGEVVQCPHCDVALTVHRSKEGNQWLRCHWCDFRSKINDRCGECGSNAFKPFGTGTQRVIDHLERELEGISLLRFDRDTTRGRDGHRLLLEKFAKGNADILVGTQMLSKGMDLPKVTLAVVLAADGLLHRPDLMATEETLQLFMQLAGRAGRGEQPGKVVVQTYCPDHPVILHLIDGRYEEFLKQEEKTRREAALVPYSRACLLRFSGESSELTSNGAFHISSKISNFCSQKGWKLVGPAPSLVERVAGKSRWQLLLYGPESSQIPLPYGSELWKDLPKGVSLSIDPDPLQL
ncbi:primosomal protein N' [Prochlorococcus marinus]|uniref:Replication restart protein PriA n=1 Tax=Prochlorococcus marinus XMU1408 TaxID=2213228 RepID=A0A318R4U5_PROMR|nr:primosomal protein N' [Prochlorococcus marinus]MBW3041524.1 primosomal protein N' [Prochlorococcus marinus str. XMU1408]PYE02682.1 primosomal protein N' [Prochlorococcus marinus XMU1408]